MRIAWNKGMKRKEWFIGYQRKYWLEEIGWLWKTYKFELHYTFYKI